MDQARNGSPGVHAPPQPTVDERGKPGDGESGEILTAYVLGGFDLYWGERRLPQFPTQKAASLFSLLILNPGRMHRRDGLANTLWTDSPETSAKRCLRTELWRLRKFLETAGIRAETYIVIQSQEVGLSPAAPLWSDVAEFEQGLGSIARVAEEDWDWEQLQRAQHAVDLYRGDLLPGRFDEWCLYQRERLKLLFLSSLERLMSHYQTQRAWERAISCGRRLLQEDPLLEQIHRSLMHCHNCAGNRSAALRQYKVCAQILDKELDVEPMEETTDLYRKIKSPKRASEDWVDVLPPSLASYPGAKKAQGTNQDIDQALPELNAAENSLEAAKRRLKQASAEASDPGRPGGPRQPGVPMLAEPRPT